VSSPAVDVGHCPHCGTAVEGASTFCCAGCEVAASIIGGAGLDRWYTEREQYAPRPSAIDHAAWAAVPVSSSAGTCSATIAVDGLSCASCVWLVERVLERSEGVSAASVSYATGRTRLEWDAEQTDLSQLARRIAALGYRPHPTHAALTPDRDLLVRFGVASFCAANAMLLSASIYAGWMDGMAERYLTLFRWAALVLVTPAALWAAAPFHRGALTGLRAGLLHMDVPISLAIGLMYGHAVWATSTGVESYADSLAMLVAALLGGRVLEARGRRRATDAATALASALPSFARRRVPGGLEDVDAASLDVDDVIEVGTGEGAAADGRVVSGTAWVRMALVTGEAEPVELTIGDQVVAGAQVVDGSLAVRVEHAGSATMGAQMAAQLAASIDDAPRASGVDRLAPWFTAATLLAAAGAGSAWAVAADLNAGVTVAVAVLVVACPCALGLATPLGVAVGLSRLADRGVVLRSGSALLRMASVDHVMLDKTGTLTEGEPRVTDAPDHVLRIAAGLERASGHPIARAILSEAADRGIPVPPAHTLAEHAGVGVSGVVDGRTWRIRRGGPGSVVVEGDAGPLGTIRLADTARTDTTDALTALDALQLPVTLLTGDHVEVAEAVAPGLEALAEQSPFDKVDQVQAHQTLFVGDGLNDAPALSAASVGLAMQGGATSAVLAADGVITTGSLRAVSDAVRIARAVEGAIRSNIRRSLAYNAIAVAFAAAGFVNPLVAAILMPLSSLMVIRGATSWTP
jgi:Cu2+-exporting ATPase